jgi:hypothetical protein
MPKAGLKRARTDVRKIRPVDTFVIRLWSPGDHAADGSDDHRGVARHVGTGRAAAFRDGAELLSLLRELAQPGAAKDLGMTQPARIEPA